MDIQSLLPLKPKERGGAISSRGLLFQKHWTLSLMLSEFQKGNDFIILFDYLDDVVVLRKKANKETISFYQVKTKETEEWNESKICGKNCIILTNLYANYAPYKTHIEDLKVISNAPFKHNGQNLHVFNFSNLSEKYKNKIIKIFSEKFKESVPEISSFLVIAQFEKTSLSFDDMDTHILGIVDKFIDSLDNCNIKPIPLKNALLSEIERRHSCATKEFKEHDSLCQQKGIDRRFIQEEIIDKLNTIHVQNYLAFVQEQLESAKLNPQQQIESMAGYNKAYKDLRSTNLETIRLFQILSSLFQKELSKSQHSFYSLVQSTVSNFLSSPEHTQAAQQYGEKYLEGIVWNIVLSTSNGEYLHEKTKI